MTASDANAVLTDEQRAQFWSDGFLAIEDFTTADDLDGIRAIFHAQFARYLSTPRTEAEVATSRQRFVDAEGATKVQSLRDPDGRLVWAEILLPEVESPTLTQSLVFCNTLAAAAQLFGTNVGGLHGWESSFTLRTGATKTGQYWHQDEALTHPETDREMVTFWVPLHDATLETGVMHFVPGSHDGPILEHQTGAGVRPGFVGDVDPTTTVACLLSEGGTTVHHQRTLHGTNLGTRRRYNYIIRVHRSPVRTRTSSHDRPWYPDLPAQPEILRLDDRRFSRQS